MLLANRHARTWCSVAVALAATVSCVHAEGSPGPVRDPDTGWSPIGTSRPILMFAPENLTPTQVPTERVERVLENRLAIHGVRLVDRERREAFFSDERIRYMGGVTRDLASAARRAMDLPAILITSVAAFDDKAPPRVSLMARLVSTEDEPRILWMDGATVAGDDTRGALGMGEVTDIDVLLDRMATSLATSLVDWILTGETPEPPTGGHRYRPRREFRSPVRSTRQTDRVRVAVLPFTNRSPRRHAGTLVALQFARFLVSREGLDVVEPGLVRQALLQARLIPEGGISFPQSEILRVLLDVDAVVTGEVLTYGESEGRRGVPAVDFAAQAIDTSRRQVVWSSISYNAGDDGVFFFDVGRRGTAQALTDRMVSRTVRSMLTERERSQPGS